MSIPQNEAQLKSKIDQDITNKTGRKSITPIVLGKLLKIIVDFISTFFVRTSQIGQPNGVATLDENGKVPAEQLPTNTGGSGEGSFENPNIKRFTKDASLTEEHIGLLAMQQISVISEGEPSSIEDIEVKVVLANTTPGEPAVKGEYELRLKNIILQEEIKWSVLDNETAILIKYNFYYQGNYNPAELLIAHFLWFAASGNPYGTPDENGLLDFADENEAINALNWAFNNNGNGNYQAPLTNIFNIITPLYYDATNNEYVVVVRDKNYIDAGSSYSISQQSFANNFTISSSTKLPPKSETPESVKGVILGTITGIDDNDVLIDTSPVQTIKMASADDGAMGIVPAISGGDFGFQLLVPWRNGTVIDLNGWAMNHGGNFNDVFGIAITASTRGCFTALELGEPGGTVTAKII